MQILNILRFVIGVGLLLFGMLFFALEQYGAFKFKYVLNRMHAASMGDSLGLLMIAAGLCVSCNDGWTIAKFLLTAFFIWITSPTGSHLIARLEMTVNEHPETEMEMIEK